MSVYSDWDGKSYLNIPLSRCTKTLNVDKQFKVIVYRFGQPTNSKTLAKFTELSYELNICPTTSLITLNYCRELESDGSDMVDNNEGVLSLAPARRNLFEFIRYHWRGRNIPLELRRKIGFLESEGKLYSNPGWIWCLCRVPNKPSSAEWRIVRDYFCRNKRYRMTLMSTSQIDEVCLELGREIGRLSVSRTNWTEWYSRIPLIGLDRNIIVIHGSIIYTDHRDEFVRHYAGNSVRSILSCFTKEAKFLFEQEYRILVLGFEAPRKDQVILRLTERMNRILNMTANNVDCLPTTPFARQADDPTV